MSPLEIWCNEAQERYVLAIAPEDLDAFAALCERERCPFAVLGDATAEQAAEVSDRHFGNAPIDLPMDVLFGKPPRMHARREVARRCRTRRSKLDAIDLADDGARGCCGCPTVADKTFLITIGDRTVSAA